MQLLLPGWHTVGTYYDDGPGLRHHLPARYGARGKATFQLHFPMAIVWAILLIETAANSGSYR